MNDRVDRVEAALTDLETEVRRLGQRVAALEQQPVLEPAAQAASETRVVSSEREAGTPGADGALAALAGTPALVGRSLLVLAGAFLLRALTEAGTFAPGTGVALGLGYAVVWIVAAARAASGGGKASAGFHSVCAALIADPLLFEASTAFGVLSPTVGAALLAGMTAMGMVVASRWRKGRGIRLRWRAP